MMPRPAHPNRPLACLLLAAVRQRPHAAAPALVTVLAVQLGCLAPLHVLRFEPPPAATQMQPLPNPLLLPPADPDLLWEQLADTVDNYFRIAREQRVQQVGGVLTEGSLETLPEIGATLLEPWRDDSTPGYEQWLATLQSIRRIARIQVVPVADGYRVSVEVLKELEDLSHPENSTVGTLIEQREGPIVGPQTSGLLPPVTLGWTPIGRDISLEQCILSELQQRMTDSQVLPPGFSPTPLP
jgi:hypothetical protein